MCLAVPLKIVSINNKNAEAEMDGVVRRIRIDFVPNVKLEDYVIVHAGFAIEILSESDAIKDLNAIREASDVFTK